MDPVQRELTVSFAKKLRIIHDVETGWDNRLKVGILASVPHLHHVHSYSLPSVFSCCSSASSVDSHTHTTQCAGSFVFSFCLGGGGGW